jgi:voltage-gated potassium channel Kch
MNAPNANIHTAEDVAWWAVVTISTVGYGELFPVTPGGRILSVFIMVVGIGSFATLVGAVAGVMLRDSEDKTKLPRSMPLGGEEATGDSSARELVERNLLLIERLERLEARLQQGEDANS